MENKELQIDFPELEGKIITWSYPDRPDKTERGLVIGCNFDIGITIVNADDKSNYLTCTQGPQVDPKKDLACHKVEFYSAVEMIQNGFYNGASIHKIRCDHDPKYAAFYDLGLIRDIDPSSCPFGQ